MSNTFGLFARPLSVRPEEPDGVTPSFFASGGQRADHNRLPIDRSNRKDLPAVESQRLIAPLCCLLFPPNQHLHRTLAAAVERIDGVTWRRPRSNRTQGDGTGSYTSTVMTRRLALGLTLMLVAASAWAQTSAETPGTLVIQGGGDSTIPRDEFIRIAGGAKANIVVIPTAAGLDSYGEEWQSKYFKGFREQGVAAISLLHTTSRTVADTDEFTAPIEKATGVWFPGGRQWRLADAYLGTKTEAALWRLLARGGVIGGTSAGATILGSYLVRGDTLGALPPIGDHERGFGFLKKSAIDQHLLVRNRQFDLLQVIRVHPDLLGIGIDEKAAIVVHGNELRVLTGYVAIYDPAIVLANDRFYFLEQGERFLLSTRTPLDAKGKPQWMPQIMPRAKLSGSELRELDGEWRVQDQVITIATTGDRVNVTMCGEARELVPLSRDLWFDKFDGWKLTVHRDADGNVAGFTWDIGRELGTRRCLTSPVEAVRTAR